MNYSLPTWLLGGALVASLSWNWRQHARQALVPNPPCSTSQECCTSFNTAAIGLEEKQSAELAELCRRSCGESDRLEVMANELQQELLARLAQPEVDRSELRRLVTEVSALRERSLAACVEGILAVREVLTPEQVSTLLESCQGGSNGCR
jgi:hypothetical protein